MVVMPATPPMALGFDLSKSRGGVAGPCLIDKCGQASCGPIGWGFLATPGHCGSWRYGLALRELRLTRRWWKWAVRLRSPCRGRQLRDPRPQGAATGLFKPF